MLFRSGVVSDPDKGITQYCYEFYLEGDIANGSVIFGRKPVRTVIAYTAEGLTVPLDGSVLEAGKGYYVRTVATFFDNEKSIEITSGLSNRAELKGSKQPVVYFVNAASSSTGETGTADQVSGWYDQLYGRIVIDPGTEGAKLLMNGGEHVPSVTIRAPGYYYVQLPVYPAGTTPPASVEKYLTATNNDGYIEIDLPNGALEVLKQQSGGQGSSTVTVGLRPGTQYTVMVHGNLSSDGTNAEIINTLVGSCVVMKST